MSPAEVREEEGAFGSKVRKAPGPAAEDAEGPQFVVGLVAGGARLAGVAQMVEIFDPIGTGNGSDT